MILIHKSFLVLDDIRMTNFSEQSYFVKTMLLLALSELTKSHLFERVDVAVFYSPNFVNLRESALSDECQYLKMVHN